MEKLHELGYILYRDCNLHVKLKFYRLAKSSNTEIDPASYIKYILDYIFIDVRVT